MELIDNLELLKVGDYIKIYTDNSGNHFISSIEEVNNDEVIYLPIKVITYRNFETSILENRNNFQIIKKTYISQKKKKLKNKRYSFNYQFLIFKLSEKEKDNIIKEQFIKLLK